MSAPSIDAVGFLDVVRPALAGGDAQALARAVEVRWTPKQLCPLLRDPKADVRRVVAFTLGLIGDESAVGCLIRALHDNDWRVNQMAEHALWSIWFRSCDPQAATSFRQGIKLLEAESYAQAIDCFKLAASVDRHFAEAYNQCALAHFFLSQWRPAIKDALQAVKRTPIHFGALCTIGHCFTQLGEYEPAVQFYRRALRINPRMVGITRAVELISLKLQKMCDSSGTQITDAMVG